MKMKKRKNRYVLVVENTNERIGDAPSIVGLAELLDCHIQTIYKTRDGDNFTFGGVTYKIIDKLDLV